MDMLGVLRTAVVAFAILGGATAFAAQPEQPGSHVMIICDAQKLVHFESDSAELSSESLRVISMVAMLFRLEGQGPIRVFALSGAREPNGQTLSERRVSVIEDALIREGLDGQGIETYGLGPSSDGDPRARTASIEWTCPWSAQSDQREGK
jgi:outer membrane protein OmpA-like peptidoglycan-associated protein